MNFLDPRPLYCQTEQDLSEFEIHPECTIELVASEPQVIDPIAIRFDELGRMWVVEMRDYPVLESGLPQSQIKILEDNDRDGYYETSTVFAEHLRFPTGIQPWKNGVIVTLEGSVIFLGDNDQDNRADEERLLFRGFAKMNTQLRANHPTFGPDGKIYIANGLRNGEIESPVRKEKVSIIGMDFRFDPNTLAFESITGHGQFGMAFDNAGNRFVCTNRNPLKRIVFESEYLKTSNNVRIPQSLVDVAAAGPDSRLFPIGPTWTTSNLHQNQFTAACGVWVEDGSALPGEFSGNAFTCDPTANLVHREMISYQRDTVAGTSRPGRAGVEFLASRNPEFRPVNLNSGPDGALYVVDMRRTVIEHPQFMPPELKQRPDLRKGNNLGRIYRVSAKGKAIDRGPKNRFEKPDLDPEKHLFDRASWWRQQAHRLMVQAPEKISLDRLRKHLTQPESHPNGVIRALSFLKEQGKLREIDYQFAISHYSQAVRTFAMRLCERIRPDDVRAGIMDESDRVRFQALLSCAKSGIELSVSECLTVIFNSSQNQWVKQAILLSTAKKADLLLSEVCNKLISHTSSFRLLDDIVEIGQLLVPVSDQLAHEETCKTTLVCLQAIQNGDWAQRESTRRGLERIVVSLMQRPRIRQYVLRSDLVDDGTLDAIRDRLKKRIRNVLKLQEGKNQTGTVEDSIELLALVTSSSLEVDSPIFDKSQPAVRMAAIRALHYSGNDKAWLKLTQGFREATFEERSEILRASRSRPDVARELLSMIDRKRIQPAEFGVQGRQQLVAHRDPDVRKRALALLTAEVPLDRRLAFEKYKSAISLAADAKNGKPVFERNCASCHRLGKLGNQIGPDISDTRTKTKSQLLLDIIRPNAAIDNNFVEYLVATQQGKTFKGIILENNATGVSLKQADNQTVHVPRVDIEKIQSSGKSLMPVGLEQDLSIQQVADLISYLQNWRYLEQGIPYVKDQNAK